MSKEKFIKCSNYIFHKKDLLYISRDGKDIEIHLLVDNKQYILNEYFNNIKAAIEECDSIFEQLQEEDVEDTKDTKEFQPQKYKITLKDFWESDRDLAIHCDTEEKAKDLLKAFDKLGKTWGSDESYLKGNYWNNYKEETCYSNNRGYTSIDWYRASGYKVYEFEDIDLDN